MARKQEEVINLGTVILYRDYRVEKNEDVLEGGGGNVIEILSVSDNDNGRLHAGAYVLPISDAEVFHSPEGVVYTYNASPRYLDEIAHLGDVERNIIVSQAFSYPGRNSLMPRQGNGMMWVVMIAMAVITIVAILAGGK